MIKNKKICAIIIALCFIVAALSACVLETQEPISVDVIFETDGGEINITEKTVTYGKTYGELPLPTKQGYEFVGWYYFPDGFGQPVTEDSEVIYTENHTLYAKWAIKAYTVTFNLNGGVGTAPQIKVGYGCKYGWLPTEAEVKRENHILTGWRTLEGITINGATEVTLERNHTLYAVWLNYQTHGVMLNDFNSSFSDNPAWSSYNSGTGRSGHAAAGIISRTELKKPGKDRALRAVLYINRNNASFRPWIKINKSCFGSNSNINFENIRYLMFDAHMYYDDGNSGLTSHYRIRMGTVKLYNGNTELGVAGVFMLYAERWNAARIDLTQVDIPNISSADSIVIELPNSKPDWATWTYNPRVTFYLNDLMAVMK